LDCLDSRRGGAPLRCAHRWFRSYEEKIRFASSSSSSSSSPPKAAEEKGNHRLQSAPGGMGSEPSFSARFACRLGFRSSRLRIAAGSR
jgi:hypothetical protein